MALLAILLYLRCQSWTAFSP